MFHGRDRVIKTSRTLNKTLQNRVHVGFLFSLLHVLKIKFKGSGRFQNVTLLGDDRVLNTLSLGTSSSRSDNVEWFTVKDFHKSLNAFDFPQHPSTSYRVSCP